MTTDTVFSAVIRFIRTIEQNGISAHTHTHTHTQTLNRNVIVE